MNLPQRYIVDLEGHGKVFYNTIRSLGIGVTQPFDDQILHARQKYVYDECASQIGTALSPLPVEFLTVLSTLPNPQYFEHFDDFMNSPQIVAPFMDAFKVFALGIYSRIHQKIGFNLGCDYHLEAVTEDFMVVYVSAKPQGIAP